MEPEGSSKSQLFESLSTYLSDKNRLQPVIGLESIIECVNVSTLNREALFLCKVCVCRLSKADMRNHIMGSLHRFNYIKACYPHLGSKWQANSDLSELARPLWELAKMLEEKDGPGDIQVFEVEDAVYQKMATQSVDHAISLIQDLKDEQAASLHCPITSDRIVLFTQNQARDSNKSHKAGTQSFEMSTHTHTCTPQVPADVAPFAKSKVWSKNNSAAPLEVIQMSPEPSVLLQYSNNFVDDYSGDKPLIGLVRVVEFRSEDGSSYCFLCHCCRIRSNKKDIIDHLFSASHLINYLAESHSEEMELISEDIEDDLQLLQSLAKKVEKEEGRGVLKVVQVPQSQCWQLTGKSYHWCLKMLSSGWTHSSTENKGEAVKGTYPTKTSVQPVSAKPTGMKSKHPTRGKPKKKMKRKMTNTVFNVSLPFSKGEMLLQGRRSFSADNLLESSGLCLSGYEPIFSPDSETADCRFEGDSSSFAVEETPDYQTSPLQQDLYQSPDSAGQCTLGYDSDSAFQDGDGYDGHDVDFNQFGDTPGTENNGAYEEWKSNRQHGSHESSSNDAPMQNEELLPAMGRTEDESSNNFYTRQQSGGGAVEEAARPERNYMDDAAQHYYQQQYQSQQVAWLNANVQPGSMWGYRSMCGEVPPYSNTDTRNVPAHSGGAFIQDVGISSEPTAQFQNADLSQMQTCTLFTVNHYHAAPQSYMTQPTSYLANQADHRLMPINYNVGPWSHPVQHLAYPISSTPTGWDSMQGNAGIQSGQPLYRQASSDVYLGVGAPFR